MNDTSPAILVSEGLVGEKDLVAAIAAQVGKRFVDLQSTFISPELDRLVPPELAVQHLAVAVELEGDHLVVAMENPGDATAVQLLEQATGFQVKPGLAVRSELQRVVTAMYGLPSGGPAGQSPGSSGSAGPGLDLEVDLGGDESAPTWAEPDKPEELHINELLQRVLDFVARVILGEAWPLHALGLSA